MNEQNEDRREELRRESDQAAAAMVGELQNRVDALEATVAERDVEIAALVEQLTAAQEVTPEAPAPAGDDELRSLAATIRNCHRNGHPDAQKHLDTLLRLLGA